MYRREFLGCSSIYFSILVISCKFCYQRHLLHCKPCSHPFRSPNPTLSHPISSSSISIVKNLPMPMRSFHHRSRGIEICTSSAPHHPPKHPPLTDVRPPVRRRLHLDIQIPIHLADDFYSVVEREVGVLPISLLASFPSPYQALPDSCALLPFCCMRAGKRLDTYPVQNHIHVTACVDDGGFAPELHDAAEEADDFVLEGGEVGGEDSGGCWVVCHFCFVFVLGRSRCEGVLKAWFERWDWVRGNRAWDGVV